MKRIFCIILVLIYALISLFGCNNAPNNKSSDTFSTQSTDTGPISTEKITEVIYSDPPMKRSVSVDSLEELSQLRELMFCTDQQELESSLLKFGFFNVNDLSIFLEIVDSVPYPNVMDGDITWIAYDEYEENIEYTVLYVTVTAENGYSARIIYRPRLVDPVSTAELRASEAASLISQPISSEDGRVTIWAEFRDSHPVYPNANYVEWIAIIDGIFTEILYVFPNTDNINTEEFLESISISSIAQLYTVAPELMEQISEGMTYKEVKEIIGALRKDVSSDAIVFEYYLSDGRAAQIEFQKLNETDDLNDFTVKSITVE